MASGRFKSDFYHVCSLILQQDTKDLFKKSTTASFSGRLSHFLTTRAEAYMNGAFQGPSATEDLTLNLYRESSGGDSGGWNSQCIRCVSHGSAREGDGSEPRLGTQLGVNRRKHGQSSRRNPSRRNCRVQHLASDFRLQRRHHDRVVRLLYFRKPGSRPCAQVLSTGK